MAGLSFLKNFPLAGSSWLTDCRVCIKGLWDGRRARAVNNESNLSFSPPPPFLATFHPLLLSSKKASSLVWAAAAVGRICLSKERLPLLLYTHGLVAAAVVYHGPGGGDLTDDDARQIFSTPSTKRKHHSLPVVDPKFSLAYRSLRGLWICVRRQIEAAETIPNEYSVQRFAKSQIFTFALF